MELNDQQLHSSDKTDEPVFNCITSSLQELFERDKAEALLLNDVLKLLGIPVEICQDAIIVPAKDMETLANLVTQLWQQ